MLAPYLCSASQIPLSADRDPSAAPTVPHSCPGSLPSIPYSHRATQSPQPASMLQLHPRSWLGNPLEPFHPFSILMAIADEDLGALLGRHGMRPGILATTADAREVSCM